MKNGCETEYHPFRSREAKENYLDFYNSKEMKWPVPYEEKYAETKYGRAYVRICGSPEGEALVLMHGGGDNSTSWAPNIKSLSEKYRIYAVDLINGNNMSSCTKSIKSLNQIMEWMSELSSLLGIVEPFHIAGVSYGAYLSARFVLHSPEKIKKCVLIAPPNFVIPNSKKFIINVLLSILPVKKFSRDMFYWTFRDMADSGEEGRKIVDHYVENFHMVMKCYNAQKFISPVVFTKEELNRLSVPVLFMIGEHDVNYNARSAIEKLNTDAPQIKTKLFTGTGHDLPILCAEQVNQSILEFLN